MGHRRTTAPDLPPRPGPRPLPLHLMAHASTLLASQAALPLWKNGSLSWKPGLQAEADSLRQSLDAAGPDAWARFEAAIAAEAFAQHDALLTGIDAYRRHPYRRALPEMPALWAEGTTRLLDYRDPARPGGLPVLLVPSLINRFYILDLTPRRSLARDLAARGLAPFLMDWGAPGEAEGAFTLTDYVAGRLSAAIARVIEATGRKPALVGYCMGGDLALAAAQLNPGKVAALALLATPWDFRSGGPQGALMRALAEPLGRIIEASDGAPVDLLNAMFASLDPALMARKFAAFARLKKRSARARDFVALEDWVNDGVKLAGPVAQECLFGWYGANDTGEGNWRVAGRAITPEQVSVPCLAMVPARDRIVPPASALALARRIKGARLMNVRGGHVGMLLSARAKTDVYAPLARWLVRSAVQ
jgi:polyhydroxyalkanoate synthase